jgi:hypothetical protein
LAEPGEDGGPPRDFAALPKNVLAEQRRSRYRDRMVDQVRAAGRLGLGAAFLLMLLPQRYVLGLDLEAASLQLAVFGAATPLRCAARLARPRREAALAAAPSSRFLDRQAAQESVSEAITRFVGLAAVLELLQLGIAERVASLDHFVWSASAILACGAASYGALRLAVRSAGGRRVLARLLLTRAA